MVEIPGAEKDPAFFAVIRVNPMVQFAALVRVVRAFAAEPAVGTTHPRVLRCPTRKVVAKKPMALQLLTEKRQAV